MTGKIKYTRSTRYDRNKNDPIDLFGPCPECNSSVSKIVYGWHGVYYDLVCPNDHLWTYDFKRNGKPHVERDQ